MSTPAGTTHRRTLRWQNARVLSVRDETPTARTYRLLLPEPRRHLAGQHYAFADAATDRLREAGVPDGVIRVERFGPSG